MLAALRFLSLVGLCEPNPVISGVLPTSGGPGSVITISGSGFADAKTELVTRRLEFFHIARAGGEITIDGAQNAKCGLAVDGTEIGASFRLPDDGLFRHESDLPGGKTELAENFFVRDTLAAVE